MNKSVQSDTVSEDEVTLVVDLDGTLCTTDTLHEALLSIVTTQSRLLWRLPGWLADGKATFKERIADHVVIDPQILPLNDIVITYIQAAREAGRRVALVSAADHRQVTAVAEATGLFDEAYGTAEGQNLKETRKAAFLIERYGAGKFDYIGDSRADLPVWEAARKAVTVRAGRRLREAADTTGVATLHLDPPERRTRTFFKALRPHQWSKNLLLFLPMLAAHDLSQAVSVLLGFVAFCMTASAVYVINDLTDLAADRAHPRKRRRPFAAGDLTAATGGALATGLLGAALITALATGSALFLGVLLIYLIATFAYSLWLKRKLIVDVLMLAGLYTIRIVAGGTVAGVELSPWMLGLFMFLFLSLAAVKRQAELMDQLKTGRESSGRAYQTDDLPILRGVALSASNAAVMVFALYISSDNVQALYAKPKLLWLICPLLLYWTLRMVMQTHRGMMTDDPIVYAALDRTSQLIILLSMLVAVAATF